MVLRLTLVLAAAVTILAGPVQARGPGDPRIPGPPPLSFRSATLKRQVHAIDVRIQAVQNAGVRIGISRKGAPLGEILASVDTGVTVVPVKVRPRDMRHLQPGVRVDVLLEVGWPEPLIFRDVPLLAPGQAMAAAVS